MKKFLITFIFLFSSCEPAMAQTKPISVFVAAGRSAQFERKFTRRQFNFSLILSVPINKRTSWNFSVVEPLEFGKPSYRTGVSFRIY